MRKHLLPLFLLVIVIISSLIPYVRASTYVGYNASNQGNSTCGGGQCYSSATGTVGGGTFMQNPFTSSSQILSVGVFVGGTAPLRVVILTTTQSFTPSSFTTYTEATCSIGSCTGAFLPASTASMTIVDSESITGMTLNAFNVVNLASPPIVTANQWIAVVFMHTSCGQINPNQCFMLLGANAITTVADICFDFLTNNPSSGTFTNSRSGGCPQPDSLIVGASFNLGTSATASITQCYGNCGNPPITLANTNSTHLFNFNQSLTFFYEFQSNINGQILNVTVNLAKSYNNGQFMTLGIYEVAGCPIGVTPFSNQCPGLLEFQSNFGSNPGFFNPQKGRQSFTIPNLSVSNGQWVGISISAVFSGLDLNDTNTNVNLFQTSGNSPSIISQSTQSSCSCKMGLWTWINGNTVTTPPSTNPSVSCGGLDCILVGIVNSFCSTTTTQCSLGAGFFWMVILSGVVIGMIMWGEKKVGMGSLIPGEMFILIPLALTFTFWSIGIFPVWVPIFIFIITMLLFASMINSKINGKSATSI